MKLIALMFALVAGDFCSDLEKIMGKDCKANSKDNCLTVNCDFKLLDLERVQVNFDFHGICVNTATKSFKFSLIEADLDIHFSKEIDFSDTGGENEEFPIPGLSVTIPITGIQAGVYGAVNVSGTAGSFHLNAGIDACANTQKSAADALTCGSSLTHVLPVWLIRGTANASAACAAPVSPTPPPTLPPTFANATAACNTCINHKQSTIGYNHVWCWENSKCYDLGDVVKDHCMPKDCASKAATSSCEKKDCTAPTY